MMRLYDTARKQKVELEPVQSGKLGIYVCGPTTYDYSHVGHARVYVAFDAVVRHLRQSGLDVTYVRNLTDVDDKIIKRANELGQDPIELSARFSAAFHEDMQKLGALTPDVEPKVSEHLVEIIAMIEKLVANKHAYVVDGGDVFFSVDDFSAYGGLSGRNLDDLRAGERVEVDERKRNPFDFALWKSAKPEEPAWDSPWGKGRPGWHIECSAMSTRYLGETFDIHGGGMDLIFPHHENEIAQSRGCHGDQTYARYWMHNGFVNVRTPEGLDEKMSKSLGNFFTIRKVFKRHEPEALRLYLLGTHYRKPISFEIDKRGEQIAFPGVEEAERRLAYMYTTIARLSDLLSVGKAVDESGEVVPPVDTFLQRFAQALDDDFNTAAALGHVAELFTVTNKLLDQPKSAPKAVRRRTLQHVASLFSKHIEPELGLLGDDPRAFLDRRRLKLCTARGIDPERVGDLIQKRRQARQNKDFAAADALRDQLVQMSIEMMDRPDGKTDWVVCEESND
jgi:cysteinyl-tRNA synthetase